MFSNTGVPVATSSWASSMAVASSTSEESSQVNNNGSFGYYSGYPSYGSSFALFSSPKDSSTFLYPSHSQHGVHGMPCNVGDNSSNEQGNQSNKSSGEDMRSYSKKKNNGNNSLDRKLSLIKVNLEMKCLWQEFHDLGTEMIVTKAGR